jgi:cytosine/adenosine deaminase-related metal-dependent hydrolase
LEILTASWVLPVAAPPLRNGRVAVSEGRVQWVGGAGDESEPEAAVRDLGPGVLLPGLVNAHCHLELSHLEGEVPHGGGFAGWVEGVVESRGHHGDAQVRAAVSRALSFLVERGTAAIGDVSNTLVHLDLLGASPLRAVVFLELLAWDPAAAERTLAWGREKMTAAATAANLELRLAAHAPHSVSPALLRLLAKDGGPAAIHLAESPEEKRFLADGGGEWAAFLARRGLGHVAFAPPGKSPVAYVDGLGVLHPGLVAAHAVQVDEQDRRTLATRGVHVVVCPRSNRNLGAGRADVPALVAARVPLALGTDSLASVETIDVLDDAVLVARQFPQLQKETIVRMATLGGAEALGLRDLGAIAPGMAAVLAFAPALRVPDDPCRFLLSGEARLQRVGGA